MAAEKPALPPYPEMILAAIDALSVNNGSNKSKISKYIENQYPDLPAGHSMLLSHHLNKMKDTGELVVAKNCYLRPDPNSPPKRGRGRPPKPKEPLPPGDVSLSPRPRGRPPKEPLPPGHVSPSPRPRGRPPKEPLPPGHVSPPPRPRGRPPRDPNAPPPAPKPKSGDGAPKRRGRPPKKARPAANPVPAAPGVKRGRGRPPKVKPAAAEIGA